MVRSCNSQTPPTVVSGFLTYWLQRVWRKCLVYILACAITVGSTLASYCPWVSCCELNERSSTFFQCFFFHPLYLFLTLLWCVWQGIKFLLLKAIVWSPYDLQCSEMFLHFNFAAYPGLLLSGIKIHFVKSCTLELSIY